MTGIAEIKIRTNKTNEPGIDVILADFSPVLNPLRY